MTMELLSILPGLDLRFAVKARHCTIVPAHHERVIALRSMHPALDIFLDRFVTAHGHKVEPAVMLRDSDAPDSRCSAEAMVALRNCLSVATILRQSARALLRPGSHALLFSDAFDFYPWSLDQSYDRMVSITPGVMALHRVADFTGQSHPGLPVHTLYEMHIDRPLFAELAAHWDRGFGMPRLPAFDRALFRSLNMANAALAMPAVQGATYLDYGRQCALWISAFEILAHHDQGRNKADLAAVLALLDRKPLWDARLNARRYSLSRRDFKRVGLTAKLYDKLYRVRNDFLHGNAVSVRTLRLPPDGRFIMPFAPLLYRLALRNYLDLHFVLPAANANIQTRLEARFARSEYEKSQYETEEALHLARIPVRSDD